MVGAALLLARGMPAQLLTSQYDNARTGAYLMEMTLNPSNVDSAHFGKLFSVPVDGDVYAQPLYWPRLALPGRGTHDVLFVATENDDLYALDARDRSTPLLWHDRLADAARGVTPVPGHDLFCPFIVPTVGISATPVIDVTTGTIFVLARTKETDATGSTRFVQRIHAIDVRTGAERHGSPVEVIASVPGTGRGSTGGQVRFDPQRENPRAALLLVRGQVVLSWASSCDVGPYHGWVMAYDAKTLAQVAVFNASPDGGEAGIWQGQAGLAADASGHIFAVTGNGTFSANTAAGRDYGNTILNLTIDGNAFTVRDYFTPHNEKELTAKDLDLGSGGPVLLPSRAGNRPNLVVAGGKGGTIYVVDRDRMGRYPVAGSAGRDDHAAQTLPVHGMVMGAPAVWNGHLYYFCSDDVLRDYAVLPGSQPLRLASQGSVSFTDPGATPVVSSKGSRNGIVWVIETKGWRSPDRPAVLHAFDAGNVAHELYSSEQNASRDRAGRALRFAMPTVADGRVYVGAKGEIDVYGVLPRRSSGSPEQ